MVNYKKMANYEISVEESHIIDRLVGKTKGKFYFTKRKPNHFMRKYQGFGISKVILDDLSKNGITEVLIEYEGAKGKVYFRCSLYKFLGSDKKHTYMKDDEQLFVSIKDMETLAL